MTIRLPIITADQRLAQTRGIKGCIFGTSGIGKTSLLWTLPEKTTLFFDLEAGDLAIEGWKGDAIRPKTWEECQDFAVFLGGPNPALPANAVYSQAHYESVCQRYGDPQAVLNKYQTIFIDSITVAGRLCLTWCKSQPGAFSERTGKQDMRSAYGLHGQEMIGWLTHLQHIREKDVWFVGILDQSTDDFGRKVYEPQIDGSKTGRELPGIVDQVITMAEFSTEDGTPYRAFICHTLNQFGYPAKDRSGRLEQIEEPHLGKLMSKISNQKRTEILDFTIPSSGNSTPQPQPETKGEQS